MKKNNDSTDTQQKLKDDYESKLWEHCSSGDEAAREELILAYRPMVYWLAKKFRVPYNTYPDLIQEGIIALINAVDAYDSGRNNRFSTYAYYKIRGRLINYLQRVEAKAPLPVDEIFLTDENKLSSIHLAEVDSTEWTIDLQYAMSALTEREASIIHALVIDGRAAKDVATEINMDVSHVYRIRRKALSKLKEWLSSAMSKATSSI